MKKKWLVVTLPVLLIVMVIAGLLISLRIRTNAILRDWSSLYGNEKYASPVSAEGVEVITQDVSCGYACIEMFSAWSGGNVNEESLYDTYGKVVTSTGKSFCEEMNRQFPGYRTTMHKYVPNPELIDLIYDTLAKGIPVPFEWAAKYGDDWTLHYSLITGLDVPGDRITVANPYGYTEELSLAEFLDRTSFEAYENMPFFFRMAFALGIFEKNAVFTVEPAGNN